MGVVCGQSSLMHFIESYELHQGLNKMKDGVHFAPILTLTAQQEAFFCNITLF